MKIIRNKQTGFSEGYGFVEFVDRATAEHARKTLNGTPMPSAHQNFRLNWASFGVGGGAGGAGGEGAVGQKRAGDSTQGGPAKRRQRGRRGNKGGHAREYQQQTG